VGGWGLNPTNKTSGIEGGFSPGSDRDRPLSPFTLIAAACAFVTAQVCLGRVSSIGPDQLVACLFFLATAFLLRFTAQPSLRDATLLGLTLGIGFVVKAVFLPLSVILIAIALLPRARRALPRPIALAIPAALLLFVIPYAAALSWAFGRITLGEAAPLNYAFHVNQLPHWMGWQGGPDPRFGTPIHPLYLLRDHPAVFAFPEPFHVTYPPQYNMPFWYDGYRHFFSPANALRAILTNLRELEKVLHENWPLFLALALCTAILIYSVPHPSRFWGWVAGPKSWPIWLPSILGVVLYLQVHLEGRYIAPFVTILAVVPFLAAASASPRTRTLALAVLLAGTAVNLARQLDQTAFRALHPSVVIGDNQAQWAIAQYLTQSGLKPGDRVASVTTLNDIRCTWAYAARLHIVAAIGNDAYSQDPAQYEDFQLFWTDPDIQADVLRLFRKQGAVAVIVPRVSFLNPPLNSSWQSIPNTYAWVLRF